MTDTPDEGTSRLLSALYAYRDSGCAGEFAEEDEAREAAVPELRDALGGFLAGRLNFGTVKYRMDAASSSNGYLFPAARVTAALSDLALGMPIDDLEPAMRRAAALPDDPGAAKGVLMDLTDFLEAERSQGNMKGARADDRRWPELLATLWHIQDDSWPLMDRSALQYLADRGDVAPLDQAQDYAEYAAAVRRMAEVSGAGAVEIEHMLACLSRDGFEVVPADERFEMSMSSARRSEEDGLADRAIELYERALSLRPSTPEALRRKAELYERKGLIMAAIAEAETLIELEPKDLADHRRLLALYKSRKMVREYNIEVRRFKALMLGPDQ